MRKEIAKRIAYIDFEYEYDKRHTDNVGKLHCFVIVGVGKQITTLNVTDFPDEVSMMKALFRRLNYDNFDEVVVHHLYSFLTVISKRAEVNDVSIRSIMDPDNKYPDKDIKMLVENMYKGEDGILRPRHPGDYRYDIGLPVDFMFTDAITLYKNKRDNLTFSLNAMAEAELGRGIVFRTKGLEHMSKEDMMKMCVDDTMLLHDIINKILGE